MSVAKMFFTPRDGDNPLRLQPSRFSGVTTDLRARRNFALWFRTRVWKLRLSDRDAQGADESVAAKLELCVSRKLVADGPFDQA